MEKVLLGIVVVAAIALIWLIGQYKKYKDSKIIKKYLAAAFSMPTSIISNATGYKDYISNGQSYVEDRYKISDDEWVYVKSIIKAFREDFLKSFFLDNTYKPSKIELNETDGFFSMFFLYCYNNREFKRTYSDIVDKIIDEKLLDENFSDFIEYKKYLEKKIIYVFNKLFLISYMYCKSNVKMDPIWSHDEESIKKQIDNMELEVPAYKGESHLIYDRNSYDYV